MYNLSKYTYSRLSLYITENECIVILLKYKDADFSFRRLKLTRNKFLAFCNEVEAANREKFV